MTKYIDKDKVAAEIKRRIKVSQDYAKCNLTENTRIGNQAQLLELNDVLSFLNTLEVKEVDLEKEISNYLDNHNLNIQDGGRIVFNNGDTPNFLCDFRDIAKHFFELGLKAKGE